MMRTSKKVEQTPKLRQKCQDCNKWRGAHKMTCVRIEMPSLTLRGKRSTFIEQWYCAVCYEARTHSNCPRCQQRFKNTELCYEPRDLRPHRWKYAGLCRPCHEAVVAARTLICRQCGTTYLRASTGMLCPTCREQERAVRSPRQWDARESGRVQRANQRAVALNLPATLTLAEWKATLEAFDRKCAYCLERPFRDLEHFIPLTLYGDTSKENCVPVCETCHRKKSTFDPDECVRRGRFPRVNIERIWAYLVNDELPTSRYCTVTRDCGAPAWLHEEHAKIAARDEKRRQRRVRTQQRKNNWSVIMQA